MSQELLYHVRLKLKQGDVSSVEKQLDRLEKDRGKAADQPKRDRQSQERQRQLKQEISTIKTLRKELASYKETLADVQREAREQGQASESNVRVQRELGRAITETKTQLESATRGNIDYDTALKNTGGNLREMKMSLRALKLAIDEVDDPLGAGRVRIQELTAEHDALNTSIGEVEQSMGVHARNVGNYEGSLRALANSVAIVQGPLGPLAGRINSTATAISRWRQANLQAAGSSIALGQAVRTGLVASGIGILIVALTSLLAFLRRAERGQQIARVGAAALSAVFQTLADVAVRMGEGLYNAFQNPMDSLQRLWTGVQNFSRGLADDLMRRIRAIPDIFGGVFEEISATWSRFAGRAKLIMADIPLIGGNIDIEKAERQIEESYERIEKATERLNRGMRNAFNVDFAKDLFEGAKEGAKGLFNTIRENVKDSQRNAREMNDILVRERNLLVERARIERDTARAREDSRNLEIDAEKRLQDILKVREAEEKMLQQELQLERDRLRVMQEQDDRFSSTEEQLREVAEQRARIFKLEEEHAKTMMSLTRDQVSVERQMREQTMREARLEFDQRMGFRNLEIEAEAQRLEMMGRMLEAERLRQFESEADFEERKQLRLTQLEAEFRNQRFSAEQAAILAQNQWKIEEENRLLEARKRVRDLELQAEQQKLQAISNLISSTNKGFFGESKALAVASTIIDTYAGVQKALAAPPGFPFNAINAAAVAAQGVANVRRIMSTQLGSTTVDASGAQVQAPSTSFGFVDLPSIGAEVASQQAPQPDFQPQIILEGEFDPEFLSVKVRQGNNKISGNTIGIGI